MTTSAPAEKFEVKYLWYIFLALLASRLLGMSYIPLNEITEARYGEIARKMLELNNWVTLFQDYNIPFLAKPPLSTWLSAGSMLLFGVNELAVRLPALLLSAAIAAMVGYTAHLRYGRTIGLWAALILCSSFGFFICAGTVMTDTAFVFCTTLILLSFWHAQTRQCKISSYVFFIACGLGLLAKGPVTLILPAMPIFFWVLLRKDWLALWRNFPWIIGCCIVIFIAGPWYYLAEMRTPGFLNYFIIGENIDRFLVSGWKGDRYGSAHSYPYGTVWGFILFGFFPWSPVFAYYILKERSKLRQYVQESDGWVLFLMLWVFSISIFFTFSANIIWPYCLPPLPGFTLLLVELMNRRSWPIIQNRMLALAALAAVVGIGITTAYRFLPELVDRSDRSMIAHWQAAKPSLNSHLIYWNYRRELSAAFYSAGRAVSTQDPKTLQSLVGNTTQDYIVTRKQDLTRMPPEVQKQFTVIYEEKMKGDRRLLLEEKN